MEIQVNTHYTGNIFMNINMHAFKLPATTDFLI